jgi:hypothetical protein
LELGEDERLLLHAAGELPAAEARALEVRLASDAALKARFDEIRGADESLAALLGGTASHDELAASEWAKRRAVERFSIAIRDAQTQAVRETPARRRWYINRYMLAGAVAASVVLGLAVWVSLSDIGTKLGGEDVPVAISTPIDGTGNTADNSASVSADVLKSNYAVVNAFNTFDEPTLDDDAAQANRSLQYILLDSPNEVAANAAMTTTDN